MLRTVFVFLEVFFFIYYVYTNFTAESIAEHSVIELMMKVSRPGLLSQEFLQSGVMVLEGLVSVSPVLVSDFQVLTTTMY